MKIMSLNCRGLGSTKKQGWIRDTIRSEKIGMVGIQETKMEVVEANVIQQLWGNGDVDFCYSRANGQSGGTLLSWDQSFLVKESVVSGPHFSRVSGRWAGASSRVTIVNVYGPQQSSQKEELWSSLLHLKST